MVKKQIFQPISMQGNDGECQRTMYTLTDDGTIYAEWEEEYQNFEIGHFLWMWDFPLRDMDQSKSTIYVNGKESPHFINHPLQDGYHYKAVFTSKDMIIKGQRLLTRTISNCGLCKNQKIFKMNLIYRN